MNRIEIQQVDITTLSVDAIVNAANESLLGGGGVDGAIHRAAGPDLLTECRSIGGCPTGEVRVTAAYKLPCHFVFHTVGPVWHGGQNGEDDLLISCYANCIKEAGARRLSSIAFPAISTGVYGFPAERAAGLAIETIKAHLDKTHLTRIVLTAFDPASLTILRKAQEKLLQK